MNRAIDLRKLPLTPVDFFIYSRVEALHGATPPTVAEVIAASGQPESVASGSINKLVELGVLQLDDAASSESSSGTSRLMSSDADMRERARNRRRELLEAQMRAARAGVGASTAAAERGQVNRPGIPRPKPSASDESLPAPREDQRQAEPSTALRWILDEVEPVAATDPRLEHGASVDLERQRRLLALRDRLRHVGHFELLGLDPTDDVKQIRRAYHVISREFHPDSFYGKNLGSFAEILDTLFRRARTSYEYLLDAERRGPLVDAHQAQLRTEQERRERELAAQNRATEDAALRARDERAQRDRERQLRIRDRTLDKRRKHAEQHAAQAKLEQEAGRHGTAATLFRLAHEHDPNNPDYEQLWRESLATARRQRAEASYNEGREARKAGRTLDAARLLAEAADAEPSLRNLSEATQAMAEVDPVRARDFAMHTLESLQQATARGEKLDEQAVSQVHQSCAKAFLAAGLLASAKEQAERAHAVAPSPQTRTLLNSIKLT